MGEENRDKVPEEINKRKVTDCYSSFYYLPPLLSFSLSSPLIPVHHFNAVLIQLPLVICDQYMHLLCP